MWTGIRCLIHYGEGCRSGCACRDSLPHPLRNNLKMLFRAAAAFVRDAVYPPCCPLCRQMTARTELCEACRKAMPPIAAACRRCGAPRASAGGETRCSHCRRDRWPATAIFCWGVYAGRLREAVIQCKHPGSEPLIHTLAEAATQWSLGRIPWDEIDLIVSVPQHWSKRLHARHNASEILADAVARRVHLPCSHRAIIRTRRASKQGLLLRKQRHANIAGAYRLRRPGRWKGVRVLIVDDIVTTGATAAAIAQPLVDAQAAAVYVMAIARGVNKAR